MDKRLKFLPGKQQQFLNEVQEISGHSVEKLAFISNVVPRSYRDWKREKLCIPEKVADHFCLTFNVSLPESKETLISRWIENKRKIAQKGAIARFIKYGSFSTLEGCRKGGLNSIKKRYGQPLRPFNGPGQSNFLAELVGILLGDGGITNQQWSITVNSIADLNYSNFISVLIEKLFKIRPSIRKRKDSNALVIYGGGINTIKYLTHIGLKVGNKIKLQVDVPDWVKRNKDYKISCLRGLMDTDGGVFLHKYKVNGNQYKYYKICFTNRSVPLLNFVFETLQELGFSPKIIDKVANKKVWLYNYQEVKRYFKVVGTNNSRLLKL